MAAASRPAVSSSIPTGGTTIACAELVINGPRRVALTRPGPPTRSCCRDTACRTCQVSARGRSRVAPCGAARPASPARIRQARRATRRRPASAPSCVRTARPRAASPDVHRVLPAGPVRLSRGGRPSRSSDAMPTPRHGPVEPRRRTCERPRASPLTSPLTLPGSVRQRQPMRLRSPLTAYSRARTGSRRTGTARTSTAGPLGTHAVQAPHRPVTGGGHHRPR